MNVDIYRGIAKRYYSQEVIHHFKSKRAPSNIPYLVDNIWEWLRPEDKPSRRTAVYASPQKSLASQYATENDYVCTVGFKGGVDLVQVTNYPDAKFHPDVKNIPKLLLSYLGQQWLESDLEVKSEFGPLFMPLLNKEQVEKILSHPVLVQLKQTLIKEVKFWSDVHCIDEQSLLTDGELFFYAKDGYFLQK